MVIKMENYVLVDNQTNIADNVVVWDGNTQEWSPPASHIALAQSITPRLIWVQNEQTKELEQIEVIGSGSIGDSWNGEKLIQPHP